MKALEKKQVRKFVGLRYKERETEIKSTMDFWILE